MKEFIFTMDNKKYHTLNYHNKTVYGKRVFKASIDAGFDCPNRDGSVSHGGCIFCREKSAYFTKGYSSDDIKNNIIMQIEKEKSRIFEKFPDSGIIAYFQAGTNTYGDIDKLKTAYYAALSCGVDGISIATRADCLGDKVMELLAEINNKTKLTVELGLQTGNDNTAVIINRGYPFSVFLKGYERLQENNIRTCVHIINGLPGEGYEDMINTAKTVGKLSPGGIKIHLLHVNKDTPLCEMYNRGEYTPLTKEEYIDIVVKQLEYIPPETVIERITGDGDKRYLIAPLWSRDKISVLGGTDKRQSELKSFQGKALEENE